MAKPTIAFVSLGGTVSSVGAGPLDLSEYPNYGERVPAASIVEQVPTLADIADIETLDVRSDVSRNITSADWVRVARAVWDAHDRGLDGVVIGHGTATLEETAYFTHLVRPVGFPVAVVGAMRPFSALSSDAQLNLVNAFRVATTARAAERDGVVVVMNDEIHAARDVVKGASYGVASFQSPGLGPIGGVDPDGNVWYRSAPADAPPLDAAVTLANEAMPRVDIGYAYAGSDGAAIDAFVNRGARGIVVAALGSGSLTPGDHDALVRAQESGVAVAISKRAFEGRVIATRRKVEHQHVAANNLNPPKARILLMLGLTMTDDYWRLQELFDRC